MLSNTERKCRNNYKEDIEEFPQKPAKLSKTSDVVTVDELLLHNVLYGRWTQWYGKRPPEDVRQSLLKNVPSDVLKNVPSEIFFDVSGALTCGLGIFAGSTIEEKTLLGPVPGQIVDASTSTIMDNAWELQNTNGQILMVGYDQEDMKGAWLTFIRPARHLQEQNLETVCLDGSLCYRSTKVVAPGDELLVWYGLQTKQCLGIPYFERDASRDVAGHKETIVPPEEEKKKLKCVVCQRGFNSRSNLRSHMRTHTLQKPFKCSICHRRFSQSSTLRNHSRLHTGERPYKCNTCQSAYSQLAGLRAHQKSSQHRLS